MFLTIVETITQIGAPAAMIVGASALVYLTKKADILAKGQEELKQDNVALLRSRIKERADIALDRKSISVEEAEDLDHLYDRYKREGGNSFVAELMKRVHDLPLNDK